MIPKIKEQISRTLNLQGAIMEHMNILRFGLANAINDY